MNITEVLPEKKIVIKKFAFSCDDIDESIPKPLPQTLNWFMLICGRPGSGKTTLLLNLICKRGKNYNKKFDNFLANVVGYPTLLTLTMGLFASPYGATSIQEYFANGFEKYFLDNPRRVRDISPVLYRKIELILDAS